MKNYDLAQIIKSDEDYNSLKKNLIKQVLEDFSTREEIVEVSINDFNLEMKLSNFISNLISLEPFRILDIELSSDFIIDYENFNNSMLSTYFTKIIYESDGTNYKELNTAIANVVETLSDLSGEFNVLYGNTMNLHSLIELADRNEAFAELTSFKIPDGLQFDEIEGLLKTKTGELVDILSEDTNVLSNYINSKTGINIKQMAQSILNVGLKPDLEGNVIPRPINTNYIQGLRDVYDFFVNATGARKALITNYKQVKKSGYLTRKLSLLMIDSVLSPSKVDDCGTHHYIKCFIEDEDTLKRINGRWFEAGGELSMIDFHHAEVSTDLIGTTINLRTPITCACEDGVCFTCYGDNLAKLNQDLHIGILSVLYLTEKLTQMLLSAKHLLQTRSIKIEWSEVFMQLFAVDRNMIMLNEIETRADIIVEYDDMEVDDETNKRYTKKFIVKRGNNVIDVESPVALYLSEESEKNIQEVLKDNEDVYILPIATFSPDSVIFNFVMENSELSASLQSILELIETNGHLGLTSIHDIYNKFIELLNESSISINSVHIEMILRELTRNSKNLIERPDFNEDKFPSYSVLRITEAILKSPSPSVSLAFEQIKKQLTEPDTFEKNGSSLLDELFK